MRARTPTALLGLLLVTACNAPPRIETVQDLVNALKNGGISVDSTTPIDFSGMRFALIDEGVRLSGNGLHVELLRVEDERTFKLASGAGALLGLLAETVGEDFPEPPQVIARKPFIVVVRKEPEPGAIGRVLDEVLPAESTD